MKTYAYATLVGFPFLGLSIEYVADKFDKQCERKVTVQAEPTNKYDSNALVVMYGEEKLGYISKES